MTPDLHIHVDTGGTFTDCLAFTTDKQLKRIKVLSNSRLRGKVVSFPVKVNTLEVLVNWGTEADIFEGYACFFAGKHPHEKVWIVNSQLDKKRITLSSLPFGVKPGDEFEITAHEEAPILAARLVTRTPLGEAFPPMKMRLGTTKGTNALLERNGARTALLITKGFADLLDIGDQQRPDLFALNIQKPLPLYDTVIEVEERLDAAGQVITALKDTELERIAEAVSASGCEAVAIALIHGYRNPIHEKKIFDYLNSKVFFETKPVISLSHEVAPAIKLVPRASTTLVNAYLSPIIEAYIDSIQQYLPADSLRIMTSAGGLVNASHFLPKDSLLSGPAGGVVGAAHVAARSGINNILTLDMGGTSTDVARYDGYLDYRFESRVGDARIMSPSIAIETVAAGGGSICKFDGGRLMVGPESAGADPGPACYGMGGPLSITDINLLLGRLVPETFLVPVNRKAARGAYEKLDLEGKMELHLGGFLRIANEKMAEAIRTLSVQKGYDPKTYTLVAFGGAGGQHACAVATLLGMTSILIPRDAGLLSALGIGTAKVERLITRQVLQPFVEVQETLENTFRSLKKEALHLLAEEGFEENDCSCRELIFLRLKGQDQPLELLFSPVKNLLEAFELEYRKIFGHWIEGREVEVESIKIIAATRAEPPDPAEPDPEAYTPESISIQKAWFAEGWTNAPVYRWEDLKPGAEVAGPSLVAGKTGTIVIEPGWEVKVDGAFNVILKQVLMNDSPIHAEADQAAALTLFTNRFRSVAEEMGALLQRTAFSVNVKERLDFSCALLDTKGELVANAPHIPVHLGSLGICVRKVKEALYLGPGDIAITNHPGFGGSHLPDITLIQAVFDSEKNLLGYVANRAHHAELGGTRPGSMPPDATSLAEEGIVIAPTYVVKKGIPQWEEIFALLTQGPFPSRAPEENMADLKAGLASLNAGAEMLLGLCGSFGRETVSHFMDELKKYAGDSLMESLRSWEKKTYRATEYLDDGWPLQVAIEIGQGGMKFDFSGTGPVHPHNLNATPAIVNSVVLYVLRLLIDKDLPLNEGILTNVKILIPEGILNPDFSLNPADCPAVVGGNTEVSQRLTDTLLKALGLAACSQGTMNNVLFGNAKFGYYETICGGTGATPGADGADAVHQHMTNTRITDPEVMELRYPVRLDRFAIRKNSGGNGKYKGGNGVVRQLTFLEKVSLTVLTQHRKTVPYGLAGGAPGLPGNQFVIRKNGEAESLAGIDGKEMNPGDSLVIETPGGGGWGDP